MTYGVQGDSFNVGVVIMGFLVSHTIFLIVTGKILIAKEMVHHSVHTIQCKASPVQGVDCARHLLCKVLTVQGISCARC
jgi:hypothetical protein